jgi:hypothetical protein
LHKSANSDNQYQCSQQCDAKENSRHSQVDDAPHSEEFAQRPQEYGKQSRRRDRNSNVPCYTTQSLIPNRSAYFGNR